MTKRPPLPPSRMHLLPRQGSQHLLVVDTSGPICRAFYANEKANTPDRAGPTALKTLANMVRGRQPTHLLFAGEGRGSIRKELFPGYKSNRPPKPDGLLACEAFVAQALAGAGSPLLSVAGLEADDVLAGAVLVARGEMPVVIASMDKDAEQLVRDSPVNDVDVRAAVLVWDGRERVLNEEAVVERRGIHPTRLLEAWALSGDSGDDVPGVSGWAEKTAVKVLQACPTMSLDDLLLEGHQYYVPATFRAKFVEHRDAIKMSRELIRLRGAEAARHIRIDELEVRPLETAGSLHRSADTDSPYGGV